jgi:hypothetical protein
MGKEKLELLMNELIAVWYVLRQCNDHYADDRTVSFLNKVAPAFFGLFQELRWSTLYFPFQIPLTLTAVCIHS